VVLTDSVEIFVIHTNAPSIVTQPTARFYDQNNLRKNDDEIILAHFAQRIPLAQAYQKACARIITVFVSHIFILFNCYNLLV